MDEIKVGDWVRFKRDPENVNVERHFCHQEGGSYLVVKENGIAAVYIRSGNKEFTFFRERFLPDPFKAAARKALSDAEV